MITKKIQKVLRQHRLKSIDIESVTKEIMYAFRRCLKDDFGLDQVFYNDDLNKVRFASRTSKKLNEAISFLEEEFLQNELKINPKDLKDGKKSLRNIVTALSIFLLDQTNVLTLADIEKVKTGKKIDMRKYNKRPRAKNDDLLNALIKVYLSKINKAEITKKNRKSIVIECASLCSAIFEALEIKAKRIKEEDRDPNTLQSEWSRITKHVSKNILINVK